MGDSPYQLVVDMVNIPWFAAFYTSQVVFSPDFRTINVCLQKLVSLLVGPGAISDMDETFRCLATTAVVSTTWLSPWKNFPWFLLSIFFKITCLLLLKRSLGSTKFLFLCGAGFVFFFLVFFGNVSALRKMICWRLAPITLWWKPRGQTCICVTWCLGQGYKLLHHGFFLPAGGS